MGPKYEFTDETMNHEGHLVHRIRRIEDGKLGGWVESEKNLSQEGSCWVDNNAIVYEEAVVSGNAQVYDNAHIFDNAEIFGNATVHDSAHVWDNAKVYGQANICGRAEVYDHAEVYNDAEVYGQAKVYDHADVCNEARVYGNAEVCGYETIDEDNEVYSNDYIDEDEQLTTVIQDFIYKIDDSDKLNVKTEYNSIDEYFSNSYQNDSKLDTLIIGTVDTKISLIKIEKVEVESKTEFKFTVDITNEKGSNFSFKSVINDAEQLNSLITQTIDALNSYPEFVKYTDDLTECLN